MTAQAVKALALKELRAQLPLWLGCMAALTVTAGIDARYLPELAPFVFAFGCLVIGAHAVGHEYAHRTMGLVLSQPVNRRGVLAAKLGVAAPLLAALGLLAYILLVNPPTALRNELLELGITPLQAIIVAVLGGLFITPYLTMLCRSSIGGLVFTVAVVFIVGPFVTTVMTDALRGAPEPLIHPVVLWYGMLVLAGLAAVGAWRLIARLETRDARGQDLHVPKWMLPARSAAALASRRGIRLSG